MAITVTIPAALRAIARNRSRIEGTGATIEELVRNLDSHFPGIRDRIFDESGKKRKFINVYVNQEDIRYLQHEATPVTDGDEVDVVVAIAGG